eukprot:scaffold8514_cov55-Phaeocystis_antarctica.AAC.13
MPIGSKALSRVRVTFSRIFPGSEPPRAGPRLLSWCASWCVRMYGCLRAVERSKPEAWREVPAYGVR